MKNIRLSYIILFLFSFSSCIREKSVAPKGCVNKKSEIAYLRNDTLKRKIVEIPSLNIVWDGNSLVAGAKGTKPSILLNALEPLVSNGTTSLNFGVGGQDTPTMILDAATQIDSKLSGTKPNHLFVWEGRNHMVNGATPSEAVSTLQYYCQQRKEAGWIVHLINWMPKTYINNSESAYNQINSDLTTYNALLNAISTPNAYWDRLIRVDNVPEFQDNFPPGYVWSASSRPAFGYYADGTHFITIGNEIVSELCLYDLIDYYSLINQPPGDTLLIVE